MSLGLVVYKILTMRHASEPRMRYISKDMLHEMTRRWAPLSRQIRVASYVVVTSIFEPHGITVKLSSSASDRQSLSCKAQTRSGLKPLESPTTRPTQYACHLHLQAMQPFNTADLIRTSEGNSEHSQTQEDKGLVLQGRSCDEIPSLCRTLLGVQNGN